MTDTERRILAAAGLLFGLFVLATLFFALPSSQAAPAPAAPGGGTRFEQECGGFGKKSSISVHEGRGRYDVRVEQGRCRLDVEIDGKVEFLDDESGVAAMERGARLEITETVGRDERRIVATPGAGGKPVYEWRIDGRAADFDAEGRAWLSRMLPLVFRTTGLDAEARVGRILERGGVDAVLDEVTLLAGDYTRRVYFEQLLRQAELDAGQLEEVIDLAGREIGSDFGLAELLIGTVRDLDAEALRIAYARAAEGIGSDFEMRRALTALVERRDLGAEALDVALRTATKIGSDFELAELLVGVAKDYPRSEPLPASFFAAAETIGSDFEMRRALDAVVARRDLTPETVAALLAASLEVGSDFEMAEFLVRLARVHAIGEEERPAFRRALDSVGSEHERERVLAELGERRLD